MTAQLSYKIDGKKFLWDNVTYDSREAAQEAMKAYVQEGFEVELLEIEDQFLVYSRRVAAEQSAS
jgi:translation elongation factor P/translation initiation factor 5A